MKTIIIYLTLCFIVFEILKLISLPTYWRLSLERGKYPALVTVETLYLFYVIFLAFVGFWYIGLCVLMVSIITAFQVMDDVIEKNDFNKQIRKYLFADGVVSIIFLSFIIIKELL